MFVKITNGIPENYTIGKLRRDNPNVSFPRDIPEETLNQYDVYKVRTTPEPSYNELTQTLSQTLTLEGGDFVQVWTVEDLPEAVQRIRLREARSAALVSEADPLFFKAHRGEATMDEWSDKVAEIRKRFPYPGE